MEESFFIYAKNGKIDKIKELLAQEKDANVQDKDGRTPLMFAVFFNQFETVEFLLENKSCNVNSQDRFGNTALMFAATKDFTDIVILLQYYQADYGIKNKDGLTAYILANKYRKKSMNYIPSNHYIFNYGSQINMEITKTILKHAVEIGSKKLIDFVLRKELYEPDSMFESFLYLIKYKKTEVLESFSSLPQSKGFVNYYKKDTSNFYRSDYRYKTLLMHACELGFVDGVRILLENGANPLIESYEKSAMTIAQEKRSYEIQKLLASHEFGNNVKERNLSNVVYERQIEQTGSQNRRSIQFGYENSLKYLFEKDDTNGLQVLLEQGLSPDYIYNDSPLLSLAATELAVECLRVLLKRGANPNLGYPNTPIAEVNYKWERMKSRGIRPIGYYEKREKDCIVALLENGAEVNVKNKQDVHIIFNHLSIIKLDNLLLIISKANSPLSVPTDAKQVIDFLNELNILPTSSFSFEKKLKLLMDLYKLKVISNEIYQEAQRVYYNKLNQRTYRITVCHNCHKPIDEKSDVICRKCKWIRCECGSCGCDYKKAK